MQYLIRVLLKAGPRPSGPEAHTVLLCSGEFTRMHRFALGLGAQMKDGEFEFVYHFNNHFNPFRFSVVFVCLQQQTETRIQMIKMVNEFKLIVVHFARPNLMQICDVRGFTAGQKKLWKIRTGLPGCRAAGPWQAVGRGPAFSKTLFNQVIYPLD